MEFTGVNKTAPPSSQAAVQRSDPPMASGAVRTDLGKDSAVQQIEEGSGVNFDLSRGSQQRAALEAVMQRAVERRMDIDDMTKNVVFKALDEKTGDIVTQIPSEQALKLRAYLRESTALPGPGAAADK
jgi:hypothetical protein